MADYPYLGIVKEAFNSLPKGAGDPTYDQLSLGYVRQLHDVATDIILRGGGATPFELAVAKVAQKRRVAVQPLEDPLPKAVPAPPAGPIPLSTAEKQAIEKAGVELLVDAQGRITPVDAVGVIGREAIPAAEKLAAEKKAAADKAAADEAKKK